MLIYGLALLVISGIYLSTYIGVIGLTLVFWSSVFLYLTPGKYAPLNLLNALALSNLNNVERILLELNLSDKGVYLPPKRLDNPETSLVFIPRKLDATMPSIVETSKQLFFSKDSSGIFLTPPGLPLLNLFEEELGYSFIKPSLNDFQKILPKLLVEDLDLAREVVIQIQGEFVLVELTHNILSKICEETSKFPRTHKLLGCLLSSAIACALAKSAGNAVSISEDEQNMDSKLTRLKYRVFNV